MSLDRIDAIDQPLHSDGDPLRCDRQTLFDGAGWKQAVESTYGLEIETFVPTSEAGGRAQYCVISDVRGSRVVCLPFSDFCQPRLGVRGWNEFSAHLQSLDLPVTIRPFRGDSLAADSPFERCHEHFWHGVDLRQGHEAFWAGLKGKVRTAVRRRARHGIRLRWTNRLEDLAKFHAMHVDLRKSKYHLLAQPFEFFANLRDIFGDSMALVLADVDGDPVAGVVLIECDGVWNYKFNASYPLPYRPNAALVVEACREGAERGLDLLDLGRSDVAQSGLVRFKRQFASHERQLTTLRWSPNKVEPRAALDAGDTLTSLTELLTDPALPNEVAARGGALLYKYFG